MIIDKKDYNILVIEDNPGDFALVQEFLLSEIDGPVISNAPNYKAASEMLSNKKCKFDVILLDLSLPDKNGEPLIHEIIESCQNAPVIVLTGYSDFKFGIKSLSLGVSDYILKDELTSLSLYKSIIYCSERKRIVAELEESEKKYSELFHLSPLPKMVFDLETLQFLDVNNAAVKHYGFSREEFISMTLKDIKPIEEIPALEKALEGDRQIKKTGSLGIFRQKKKNGDIIDVEIRANLVKYKGKEAKVIVATDVTERLKHIKAIEAQNKRLREISWIQSHIVRAPLARILGLIPLFKDPKVSIAEKETMLEYILLAANELDEIIKEISDKTIMDNDEKTRE